MVVVMLQASEPVGLAELQPSQRGGLLHRQILGQGVQGLADPALRVLHDLLPLHRSRRRHQRMLPDPGLTRCSLLTAPQQLLLHKPARLQTWILCHHSSPSSSRALPPGPIE